MSYKTACWNGQSSQDQCACLLCSSFKYMTSIQSTSERPRIFLQRCCQGGQGEFWRSRRWWCKRTVNDWGVLLLDVIMNIAVVIYSQTSERLKRITFGFEGNAPSICLNASMFARITRDPASPTEEVSTKFLNESLQIAFPNNVLISQFQDECG